MTQPERAVSRLELVRDALRFCATREHLQRTVKIALVVGVVLTAINEGDVIASGKATATTGVKMGLNFVVPFVVSNLGLLAGRQSTPPGTRVQS
ncbi:MAG: nitrate/nitrite transporter NrtS [Gaiellaceae bacterium]